LGKPKALQVEEDKVLAEVIVSVIYQIMSLTRKRHRRGHWIPHKTIPIEGNFLKTWRGEYSGRVKLSLVQKEQLSGMLTTWLKDASPSTRRVGLTRDCTGTTTSSILG
jgi:hypothetical protein